MDNAGGGLLAPVPMKDSSQSESFPPLPAQKDTSVDSVCPICGGPLQPEKCKVVCRSSLCRYRVVMTCAEF